MGNFKRSLLYIWFVVCCLLFDTNLVKGQCVAKILAVPDSTKGCSGLGIQFKDVSIGIHSRSWNFGDGTGLSTSQNPNKTFTTTGIVRTFKTSLAINCPLTSETDTAYYTVSIYPYPVAAFTVSKTSFCSISEQVCISNQSSTTYGETYSWDFGDESTANISQPCHVYYNSGIETISLTVKNQYGCEAKAQQSVNVKESPNPEFSLNPFVGCVPLNVSYVNQTQNDSSLITNWLWDFGNGITSSNQNPSFALTYTNPGTYMVSLTATNTLGCTNYTINPIVVSPRVPISLSPPPSNACPNTSISLSVSASSVVSSFSWSVGDGVISGPSNGKTINVKWPTGGTKKIVVSGNANGCIISDSASIIVSPVYSGTVGFTQGSLGLCVGGNASLTILPVGMAQYTFKNGNSVLQQSTTNNSLVLHNLQNSISITPSFLDPNNCLVTLPTQNITVSSRPNITISTNTAANKACDNHNITLTASPTGLSNYAFYVNFLPVQSGTSNTYQLTNVSTPTSAYVIGTNATCDSSSSPITIALVDSILPPQVNCGLSSTNFITFVWDSVTNANSYDVSINNGTYTIPSSGSKGLSQLLTGLSPNDSATIVVRALAKAPCSNYLISNTVTCYARYCPEPLSFSLSSDSVQCPGGTVQIKAKNIVVSSSGGFYFTFNGSNHTQDSTYNYSPVPSGNSSVLVVLTDPALPGCTPVKKTAFIKAPVINGLNITSTKICSDTNITFTVTPSGLSNYNFYLGNVLVQSGSVPVYTFTTSPGTYTLSVTGINKGCIEPSATKTFDINNLVQPTLSYVPNDTLICGDAILFSISPSGYPAYYLNQNYSNGYSNTILSSLSNIVLITSDFIDPLNITNEFKYNFNAQYIDANGCKSPLSNNSKVSLTGAFDKSKVVILSRFDTCSYSILKLKVDSGYVKYIWTVGNNTFTTRNSMVTVTVPSDFNSSGFSQSIFGSVQVFRDSTCSATKDFRSINQVTPILSCDLISPPCGDSIKCIVQGYTVVINNDTMRLSPEQAAQSSYLGHKIQWSNGSNNWSWFEIYYPYTTEISVNISGYLPNKCHTEIYDSNLKFKRENVNFNGTASYCIDKLNNGVKLSVDSVTFHYFRWKSVYLDTILSKDSIHNFVKQDLNSLISDTTSWKVIFKPKIAGNYKIYGIQCIDSAGITCCGDIEFDLCVADCIEPFISNALSPNADGVNDTWNIVNIKNSPEVLVFSRWGDKVFEDKMYKNTWEGTDIHNKPLPDGVYLYTVNVNSKTFYTSDTTISSGPNYSIEPKALIASLGYNPDSLIAVDPSEYDKLIKELFSTGLRYKNNPSPDLWKMEVVPSQNNSSTPNSLVQNQLLYSYSRKSWQCKYKSVQSQNGTLLIQR